MKAEEEHKLALGALCEQFATEIEDAYAAADAATTKKLVAEQARLLSEEKAKAK